MENPPSQQPETEQPPENPAMNSDQTPEKPATNTEQMPENPASQAEKYSYPMEPDIYCLIVPYLYRFDFEDEEYVDDSYFCSSDDDDDSVFPNAYETVKRFLKQVRLSRGYDVDCVPPLSLNSPFLPVPMFKEFEDYYEEVKSELNVAIGEINTQSGKTCELVDIEKVVGKTYELVDIEKVVETRNCLLLLTFTAKEVGVEADANAETAVKTFRAMVRQLYPSGCQLLEWDIIDDHVAIVG